MYIHTYSIHSDMLHACVCIYMYIYIYIYIYILHTCIYREDGRQRKLINNFKQTKSVVSKNTQHTTN